MHKKRELKGAEGFVSRRVHKRLGSFATIDSLTISHVGYRRAINTLEYVSSLQCLACLCRSTLRQCFHNLLRRVCVCAACTCACAVCVGVFGGMRVFCVCVCVCVLVQVQVRM